MHMSTRTWDELVEAGKRLAGSNPQWELGDLAGEVDTRYGEADLEKYAKEIGVKHKTLLTYRTVARAFPEISIRRENPFGVYQVFATLDDRLELVKGKYTVAQANALAAERRGPRGRASADSRVGSSARAQKRKEAAERAGVSAHKVDEIARNPGAVKVAIESDPEFAAMVADALAGITPANGRPKNFNGKSNAKRLRELKDRGKTDHYNELRTVQLRISELCGALESVKLEDYNLSGDDEVTMWRIVDIFDDLLSLAPWVELNINRLKGRIKAADLLERAAKFRNVGGRTDEEIKIFIARAEKLEAEARALAS